MHEGPPLYKRDTVAHICCCCSKRTIDKLLGNLFPGCKLYGLVPPLLPAYDACPAGMVVCSADFASSCKYKGFVMKSSLI